MNNRSKCVFWLAILLLVAGCSRGGSGASQDGQGSPDQAATGRAERPADKSAGGSAGSQRRAPTVLLHTSQGDIVVRLDAQRAPRTVNNFLYYVESGHYDQTILHQVAAGYVVVGGGYTADLVERPGRYPIPNEADNGLSNRRGTIAMARRQDVVDSSTCQFFINLADNPALDHRGPAANEYGFCVFGEVIEGWEVVDKIAEVEVEDTDAFQELPVQTVSIESARRLR